MDHRSIAITIRAKKLGVLIRGARQATEKSVSECSQAIGVSTTTFEAYERGEISPSLPELEALAFYLKIPLELFWGREMAFPREQQENQRQEMTFGYCRQESEGNPCRWILDCWWERFDVRSFLQAHLSEAVMAQVEQVAASPPPSKVLSLLDLVQQTRERLALSQREEESQHKP